MADHPKTRAREFPETRWSLVLRAQDSPTEIRRDALEDLCRSYWPAIYGFARFRGHSPSESENLTQGFLASLLEREGLEKVKLETGRLRSWLIRAFENWRIDQHRRAEAKRRGGGWIAVEITDEKGEERWERFESHLATADRTEPELAFDRIWALSVLVAARQTTAEEFASRGKAAQFAILEPALDLDNQSADFSGKAAAQLGMKPAAVRKAIQRLRQVYAQKIREAIAQTLSDAGDVEAEFRALRESLM